MPDRISLRILQIVLAFLLLLPAGSIAAQDGESEAESAQSSPATQSPPGWLQVVAVTCEVADGSASVAVYLAAEYAPGASCYNGYADVWLDGVGYGAAGPVLELQLEAASYSLMEPVSGVSRVVDIYADSLTVVYLVSTIVVPREEEVAPAQEVASTDLAVQMHVCDPGIQDIDGLLALGSRTARLSECPVLTLPGYNALDGTENAGQAWFDVAVTGSSGFAAALSNGAFVPDAVCESTLGVQLSTNPYDDACFSTSSLVLDAPQESLTMTVTALPELHRFGYAEAGDDVTTAWVIDQPSGTFGVDLTASTAGGVVHVYLFAPPRLTVVQHLCGPETTTLESFQAIDGFLNRTTSCPAVTREGFGFDATIADGWGVSHALSNVAPVTLAICEADLGFDINGQAGDNACLEFAAYPIVKVERGAIEVYPAFPAGFALAGVDFTPGSNDAATLLSVSLDQPQIALDTTFDGNVVLHIYAYQPVATPPEPTPTDTATATATAATATPTASGAAATSTSTAAPLLTVTPTVPSTVELGTLQVVALYCLGSQNQTSLWALPPGQQAGEAQIGGQCFGGDARVQVAFAGQGAGETTQLGRDGVVWFENAPAGTSHSITDLVSGKSTTFSVQPGAVTRVVLRIDAALGAPSAGSTSESSQGNGTTTVNPLDLLGLLVTDVLVTDVLNIADAGEMSAGSYDANAYTVDLLGGLAVDQLASITADGLPAVGNGERATSGSGHDATLMAMLAAATVLGFVGWSARFSRRVRGLSRH